MSLTSKTIAVFDRPFNVPGFDETLPAGAYELETKECAPSDRLDPMVWKTSVLVKLHTRTSHPGLAQVLTVSLTDLERAHARDKASGKTLTDFFLAEMLSDPSVLLVMQADGVSDAQRRHLYSGSRISRRGNDELVRATESGETRRLSGPPRMKACRSERDVRCLNSEAAAPKVSQSDADAAQRVL